MLCWNRRIAGQDARVFWLTRPALRLSKDSSKLLDLPFLSLSFLVHLHSIYIEHQSFGRSVLDFVYMFLLRVLTGFFITQSLSTSIVTISTLD